MSRIKYINIWFWIKQDRDFTCTEDGLFPSATDCCSTMYYKCSNGVASEEVILREKRIIFYRWLFKKFYFFRRTAMEVPILIQLLKRVFVLHLRPVVHPAVNILCSLPHILKVTKLHHSWLSIEISTELPTTSLTTPGGGGFDCPTSNGFFPIPGTCGSDYYACVNGSPYFAVWNV